MTSYDEFLPSFTEFYALLRTHFFKYTPLSISPSSAYVGKLVGGDFLWFWFGFGLVFCFGFGSVWFLLFLLCSMACRNGRVPVFPPAVSLRRAGPNGPWQRPPPPPHPIKRTRGLQTFVLLDFGMTELNFEEYRSISVSLW